MATKVSKVTSWMNFVSFAIFVPSWLRCS